MIQKIKSFITKLYFKFLTLEPAYYINGPVNLPEPLSADAELKALEDYANGDKEARDLLITHNLRLVVYISRKFDAPGANIEDLISIGTIGLIKAVNTFKADKNIKLATYASRCIENEILMFMRKSTHYKNDISIDEPLNVDWDGNELLLSDVLGSDPDIVNRPIEQEDERNIVKQLVDNLPAREREIMQMRFGFCGYDEHTQKQVAEKLGISQSYISRLEKKILERLKKDYERTFI